VQTPYLWTDIKVYVNGLNKKKTRMVLSRVDLFLSRAGDLPLDVIWHAYGNRKSVPQFYDLFREKGPFIRWRTLSLNLDTDITHPLGEFRESDSFTNLVRLTLVSQLPPFYLRCLNETISTKLDRLDLGEYFRCSHDFHTEYSGILHATTTLDIWDTITPPAGPFPPNVTILRAVTLPDIVMPHIRHVYIDTLGLVQSSAFNLTNVVRLEINVGVDGCPTDASIDLPNLRYLTLWEDSLSALSALKTPSLRTLSIKCFDIQAQTVDGPFLTALRNGFQVSRLLELLVSLPLDGPAILEALRFFPGITHLGLRFYDAVQAEEILRHVFPEDQRNFNICPSIHAVYIQLAVPPSNEKVWRDFVWRTGPHIGYLLWSLESEWPGGLIWRPVSSEAEISGISAWSR
jgi:hypothetical protein